MRLDQIIPREQFTKEWGSGADKIRVTIRTADYARMDKMRRACRPPNAMSEDEMSLEAWKAKILDELLVDVQGLEDENGSVAYTREVGRKMLGNPMFAAWVVEEAQKMENALGEGGGATA